MVFCRKVLKSTVTYPLIGIWNPAGTPGRLLKSWTAIFSCVFGVLTKSCIMRDAWEWKGCCDPIVTRRPTMNRLPCSGSGVHDVVKTDDLKFGKVVGGICSDCDGQRKRNLSITLWKAEILTSGFPRQIQWVALVRLFRPESAYPHSMTQKRILWPAKARAASGSARKVPNVRP